MGCFQNLRISAQKCPQFSIKTAAVERQSLTAEGGLGSEHPLASEQLAHHHDAPVDRHQALVPAKLADALVLPRHWPVVARLPDVLLPHLRQCRRGWRGERTLKRSKELPDGQQTLQ